MLTMHGRIQKILSGGGGGGGGLGVLRSLLQFFYFTEGSADLTSLSKQLGPRGPTSSRGCQ